jgi:hypothetical protein
VNPVGPNDHVSAGRRSIGETQRAVRLGGHDPMAKVDPRRRHVTREEVQQRDAVHAVVGRAERVEIGVILGHRLTANECSILITDAQRRRRRRDLSQFSANPQPLELPNTIGRQRHRRANLTQLIRLLIHLGVDPKALQGPSQHQPPDTATCDRYTHSHPLLVSESVPDDSS